MIKYVAVLALVAVVFAQEFDFGPDPPRPAPHRPRPAPARVEPGYSGPTSPPRPPVAILKQIDRHNDDGSYTYGYESGDGSFKIETKLATGEVKGKYGYVDDTGKVRVIEYGATRYGFEPSGDGITVPPPTLVDESTNKDGTTNQDYAGDYYDQEPAQPARAQPSYKAPAQSYRPAPAPAYRPAPAPAPAAASKPDSQEFSFDFGPQQFQPAAARPRPSASAPVPPRITVPGAAPASSDFQFAPSRPAPAPRPQQPSYDQDYESAPAPRPAPKVSYNRPPAQQFSPAPRPAYSPRPSPTGGRPGGGSILDQLSKDYALPSGSNPSHDISFGYY